MLIHPFSPLFLLPVLIDYEFAIGASRFFVAYKKKNSFTQGQTLLPGMANKGAAKKEVENKWTRSQTKFKMALFVVPPQK